MVNYYWFSIFVAANALLLLALAANVSVLRLKKKISYGDGGDKDLLKAIRVHANGMEQVPIFALLLLALTLVNASSVLLVSLALCFTVARMSHAFGMLSGVHIARSLGAGITYLLQGVGAVALLVNLNV